MNNPKILVIDDEKALRDSIKMALKGQDLDLTFAENGRQGIELLEKDQPEVIILDLLMPVMGGIDFLKEINLKPDDHQAVIVLTGHGNDSDMQSCYNLGVNFFLRKPFSITEIVCHVSQALKIKNYEREKQNLIAELQESLAEIKTLQGLLSICSFCKKIRNENGTWEELETYINKHSEAQFSHGMCQECARINYPKYFKD